MSLWINYLDQILLFATLALSLNLLLGYAGQVSVAHAAFGAIGGYAMAYTTQDYGWNFLLGTLVGMVLAFVIGTLVALPALKLSVEYLILLTLAVSSVIIGLLVAYPDFGGTYGLINLPPANLFGWHLQRPEDWLLPAFVAMAVVYFICYRVGESPIGRVLKGIREDPVATQALGKNVLGYKVAVFGLTSALAAFAGAMIAAWLRLSTPGVFGFSFSLTIFAVVIFGGMGNLTGTVLGAAIVVLLEPLLERVIDIEPAKAGYVAAHRLRPRPRRADAAAPAGRPAGGLLGLAMAARRSRCQGARRDGRRVGALDRRPRRRARRQRAVAERGEPPRAGVAGRPGRAADGGRQQALRRDRRRPRARHRAAAGHDHRPRRSQRGRQDDRVQPVDRGDPARQRLGAAQRRGARRAEPGAGRPQGHGPLVPGRAPVQPAVVPAERDDGRAGPAGRELRHADRRPRQGHAGRRPRRGRRRRSGCASSAWASSPPVPAGALSYGQTKLVSLARVLATEAEVLLLDEPASGIDTKWVDTMLDLIEQVRDQGRTVCVVEHNLHVVGRLADHTYFMELGEITAQGTIAELTNTPRLAEVYFGTG